MEATTSSCTDLEITIISGENVHVDRRRPVRKKAFVMVQTDSQMVKSRKIDVHGGSCPAWNEKLDVQVPMHSRFITVQVQCEVSKSISKTIGQAQIPISDFVGGYFPHNYLHFLSYRLRNANGERNGIINISVRTKVNDNGIVTGIPTWNTYRGCKFG